MKLKQPCQMLALRAINVYWDAQKGADGIVGIAFNVAGVAVRYEEDANGRTELSDSEVLRMVDEACRISNLPDEDGDDAYEGVRIDFPQRTNPRERY